MVQTVKMGLKAFDYIRDDVDRYLLQLLRSYRPIPHRRCVHSSSVMMGRQIQSSITMSYSTNEKMWYQGAPPERGQLPDAEKTQCNIYRSKNIPTQIWIYEIDKGNPEIHEIGSGTKLFITFLSLRFFDMRRERHNFLLCWLFVYRQLSTHWLNQRAVHFVDPNDTKNRRYQKSTTSL